MTTQILCRIDHENEPVVFLANTLNNGRIKAWIQGNDKVQYVGYDYYKLAKPLSEEDSKELAKRYSEATGDKDVYIRQRLPRVYRTVPNRLTGNVDVSQGKTNARSAAAKRRVVAEQAAADALANAQLVQEGQSIPVDEEKLEKLSKALAKALIEAGI